MDSLFENLTVGLAVGVIVSLLLSLYYSKFKVLVIGVFVVIGVVSLYSVVEFYWDYDSGNRGNLEQTLLNRKSSASAPAPDGAHMPLDTLEAKVSYILGRTTATQLSEQGLNLEPNAYALGMRDGMIGQPSRFGSAESQALLTEMQELVSAKTNAGKAAQSSLNLESSEAFLAANSRKESIFVTDSGLQYKVLSEGSGPRPNVKNVVKVHYEGRLIDGTIFDSSYQRGQPASFGVNKVISGWTEALQLMPEGSTWELYIHPALAYGENGPPSIGPNQALIFKVELLKADTASE